MVLPSQVKKQGLWGPSVNDGRKPKKNIQPPKPPKTFPVVKKVSQPSTPGEKGFVRRNWCWGVRICLALIGIGIPLIILFAIPCEGNITLEKQPVDMFIMLDASGSVLDEDWEISKQAARSYITAFQQQVPNLQVGIGQFSDTASVDHSFNTNVTHALHKLGEIEQQGGGTQYIPALQMFQRELEKSRREGSFVMALFISDGEPSDDADPRLRTTLSELNSNFNATIVGVMIGATQTAEELMYEISSCPETYTERTDCSNYLYSKDFAEFSRNSDKLANSVSSQVGSTSTETCDPGLWWLSLLLLLPLLLVFLLPCCVRAKKKKYKLRNDVENPAPLEKPEKGAEKAPVNTKKKRFKWDTVAADKYLWNFSGGATPMKVNYGRKAPPSAPKDLSKGKIKRGVEVWEDADGWTWEAVEEDQTLEEWAEDQAQNFASKCCCCCFKKK